MDYFPKMAKIVFYIEIAKFRDTRVTELREFFLLAKWKSSVNFSWSLSTIIVQFVLYDPNLTAD